MKRVVWLSVAVALMALSVPARAVRAGEAARLCEFGRLTKVLKISGKQHRAMAGVLAGFDRKLKSWDAANAKSLQAIDAELAKARKKSDIAKMCDALGRQKALQGERAKLVSAGRAALLALLTGPQRAEWQGYLLFTETHVRFGRLGLTKDQISDIRSRCVKAGLLVSDLRTKGKAGEAAKVEQTLERKVVKEVLTDSQRNLFARAGGGAGQPRTGQTERQRRERIRLAVAGWIGKRITADQVKGVKDTEAGMNAQLADALRRREAAGANTGGRGAAWREEMLRLMNEARRVHGVAPLLLDGNLNVAAQSFVRYISETGKFSHSADGRSPTERAKAAGYSGGTAENIAMGPSHVRPVFDMWMKSSGHRANILGKAYRSLGLGWQGKHWVANFGMK